MPSEVHPKVINFLGKFGKTSLVFVVNVGTKQGIR